jgi:hypothetical protein
MVNSKFEFKDKSNPWIRISEGHEYGLSIKNLVFGYFIHIEELTKYHVFRAFFEPKQKEDINDEYQVIIVTDEREKELLCCIIRIDNYVNDTYKVINFNKQMKK